MDTVRTVLGLIIIIALLGAVGAVLWRRRGGDEIHSIDSYRHALETLQEMRGPSASSTIRVLGADEQRQLRQPPPHPEVRSGVSGRPPLPTPPPPPEAVSPPPLARDGMVFGEGLSSDRHLDDEHHEGSHHERAGTTWAMDRARSQPRVHSKQLIAAAVASVVILFLVIVGAVIGRSGSGKPATTTSTPKHAKTTTPPTTTTMAPKVLDPQDATTTSATYLVSSSEFVVTVTATKGPCWTIATDATGQQVYAGGIEPGTPQQIKGSGTLSISVGAPENVSIAVDRASVRFPEGVQTPFVLTIKTASQTTTTTTPLGTPTTTPPVTTTSIGAVN